MTSNEKINQSELNAREFEHWQKLYYDEVLSFYLKNNPNRGEVAFNSWESRFLTFLENNYPLKFVEYKEQTKGRIHSSYEGTLLFDSFKAWRGNVVEPFLDQCIQDSRRGYIEKDVKHKQLHVQGELINPSIQIPKVFISHSEKNLKLVKLIVDLIRSALNLSAKDIRCTSLDGYRLPVGADIDEQIRTEVLNAKTLIGVISKESFGSAYVLFELGARWGQGLNMLPLLAHGTTSDNLQGPVKGMNALRCNDEGHMLQFVNNIANHLGVTPENPDVYHNIIKLIVNFNE